MKTLVKFLLVSCIGVMTACSSLPGGLDDVLKDKRTKYRKSKDLPVLEVPPDLSVTKGEYEAAIPSDSNATSLSEFQRQREQHKNRGMVLGAGEGEGEQWLVLRGEAADLWPSLRQFWQDNEYEVDLDDAELGVLETAWKENEGEQIRFKLFTEPDEKGGTVLFLSSERQVLSEGVWLEAEQDQEREKKIVRKISKHFHGSVVTDTVQADSPSELSTAASRPLAEVQQLDEDKSYLVVPKEFTAAWRDTRAVIERAGHVVEGTDQSKGIYYFLYFRPQGQEEGGFFKKLKFWGDDDDDGVPLQLSLTGVGDKTEVIIMNKDGEWQTGEEATEILYTLERFYNQL